MQQKHAVTGAFGYSGKYIAQSLLERGHDVITLTNSLQRPTPFGDLVHASPFHFDAPDRLVETLSDVAVLYNTYWVRFNHKHFTFADAIENSRVLFKAARDAGVERIVHVSITNPSEDSHLEYFSGKAVVEKALKRTGLSYAILRPTVLFGKEDILINNIVWMLRRFPIFGVFGTGAYRLQPIYVGDFAALAVEQGARRENVTINAIGPETFTYRELVKTLGAIAGAERPIVSIPPTLGYLVARLVGAAVGDVVVTRDEIEGLMQERLYVDAPPTGTTRLTTWARQHADSLGTAYASELDRRRAR